MVKRRRKKKRKKKGILLLLVENEMMSMRGSIGEREWDPNMVGKMEGNSVFGPPTPNPFSLLHKQ